MKITRLYLAGGLLLAAALFSPPARAEYGYFSDVQSGSDIVVKEVRWPYWNNTYYNTWWSDNWRSTEGTSGYFYNGLALPAAGSPNPVGTQQTVNWSFWPLSSPVNITDDINPLYTSPNTFAMPTIGEGTILRSPGKWTLWQTNVWYRMVIRTWQPVSGAAHLGYAGTWMRDPVAGVWYHMASIQLPFSVTGIDGSMSFQENATGGSNPQRTDYRASYYHKNGAWISSTNWYVYVHASAGVENTGLIETNSAVYYETCKSNGVYTGTLTTGQTSPTYHITQSPTQAFDPIVVTNYGASISGSQLLVQWQTPATSSPQFAYQIDVYTNASYTGTVVATAFDIAPEAQQKMLNLGSVTNPFPRLTIIDIFNQTNAPINLTATNASLNAATSAPGAVNGLNFAYYQSATSYTTDSSTNWSTMPNFAALAPVSQGAVSGVDLSPRQRRNGYAFNYTGYINVASNGLYAFTLNSCDGSKLYVDGQLVVNNDGEHSPADLSGWAGLQAGYHTLNLQYFFDTQPTSLFSDYFDTLTLSYEGPGIGKTVVPASAFYRVPGGSEPAVSLSSPVSGSTVSGASVPLSAAVTANGNTINSVQFYVGNNYWAQDTTSPYSLSSFFWANPSNAIRARLFYNSTNIIDSAVNYVNTTNVTLAPWQFGQIFYHNYPSGASIVGGTYSLIGDGVNLLTRQINGDCTLIAHLSGLPSTAAKPDGSSPNSGWLGGVILRGTTNMVPGYPWGQSGTAPFVSLFGQVDGGTYYQDEDMVNGGGGYSRSVTSQKWFKLVRTNGTNFTSYVSADGTAWTQVGNTNLTDFGTTVYAGLYTYAGPSSNPSIHWASFDNVSVTGNLVGPPGVTVIPAIDTAYTGQSSTFTAAPSGNAPFTYQWQYNNVNITGATNTTLSLTNLQPSTSGLYTVVLNNTNGTATATATLTVLTPPPVPAQIISNNPVGYWRLNETAGPTAYDSVGSYNGTGEGGIVFGVPGVTNSPFTGFESGNLAAQFNGTDSDVSIPSLNFSTTNFTITGWVKCNGAQTSSSGLVFSRGSGFGTGLMAVNNGSNLELRYSWNDNGADYGFSTGLNLPTNNVWAYMALTIEPTRAIVYLATNSVLLSKTNNVTNSARTNTGSFYFGYDPNSSTRRINGALDEIAIYNRTLTPAQIGQILAASQQFAPAVSLDSPASGAAFGSPATISLNSSVSTNGHAINYVQFFNGTNLLGVSSNAPYSLTWTNVSAGTYTVFAQLVYDTTNTVSSAPAFITVNLIPSAPASITPVALSGNLISITWPATTYATGYVLSRNGTVIAYLAATNYLDLGLSPSTTYAYSVMATNVFGNSPSSVTNSATTAGSGTARWWDAGGSTSGAQDGDGNWGSSASTWWNGSANVTWADNNLVLFGNGTTTNCAVNITNNVTPSGMIFNANNGGTYNFSSSGGSLLILSGTPTITCNDSATITAPLNSGGFKKVGAGTLTITGGNTNTGAITIGSGKLLATGGGWYGNRSIGSGALTVSNGAVAEFSVSHGFGYGSGGQPVTLNNGSLQLDGDNYGSAVTMTAGSITVASGHYFAPISGMTCTVNAAATASTISTPRLALQGAVTFSVARGSGAVDLQLAGASIDGSSGAITKTGAGILQISSTATNYGTTTISAGTLQVDGSLGTNTVSVASTATLAGTGGVNGATTVSSSGTLAPGDAGIGKLAFATTLTLNAGSKTILELSKNGGVPTNDLVSVTGTLALGGTLTVTNIGTNALTAGDSFDLFNAGTFSGGFTSVSLPALGGGLVWNTNSLAVNGIISVAVNPNAVFIWSGAVNGTWDIGTTANWTSGGAGTVFTNNANVQFDDSASGTTAVTVNTAVSVVSATFANTNKNYSISGSGSIGGTAALVKGGTGSLTLATTNTYTGPTTVNAGGLQVNGTLPAGAVTVATNATLGGAGTIYGPTTIQLGGTLQPGLGGTNTGTLTISNSLNLSGNVLFTLNRSNTPPASKIAGLGTVTYGGTLTVTNAGTNNFAIGDTFTLFQATNYSGSFTNLVLPTLAANQMWNTAGLTNGSISVTNLLLVQNGGFEAGSFAGWTLSGSDTADLTVVNTSTYVHSGTYGAQVGPYQSPSTPTALGFISQTLTTVSGQAYVLSFWLKDSTSGNTRVFLANWNSNIVYGVTNETTSANWSNRTFIVTATSASTLLQFGFYNDPGYFGFDDVTLTPTNDTLTYLAGANGTISGTPPQVVSYNASGSAVSAVPNTGYHFVNWSDSSAANPRTDTNVKSNLTVTANFAINTYTLTYLVGANGTLTGTATQTVNYATSGTAITAVPTNGYHFVNWSDSSTANPRTDANVTNNLTVTANFAINTYTLIYLGGSNGALTGTATQTVNYAASGTAVSAVPNSGYAFTNWTDGSLTNPRTDANATSNITVTANFVLLAVVPPVITGSPVLGAGGFQLTFSGPAGQTYKILTSTNLSLPVAGWSVLTNGTFSAGPVTFTNGLPPGSPAGYFRIASP